MSHQKDVHYWSQLRAALTSGQWTSQFPAKAPNGTALSWSELIRKFNKHCKGFTEFAEVASHTKTLAVLLASRTKEEKDTLRHTNQPNLGVNEEYVLPQERLGEARACYDALKSLDSSNCKSVLLALAYHAYALGNPSECLSHLEHLPDLLNIRSRIPYSSATTLPPSNSSTLGVSTQMSITSAAPTFATLVDSHFNEVRDGRGWSMTETLRSICLQGLSYEKLYPEDPLRALKVYDTAIPLFDVLLSEFTTCTAPNASGKSDFSTFPQFRELWQWVELLVWRAVVLNAKLFPVLERNDGEENTLWRWLSIYSLCSVSWPPDFATTHRSTISTLYLRALILRNRSPIPQKQMSKDHPAWLHTARTVVQDFRAILNVCTKFPRAGRRNMRVEEFVDLCVAVWEASGAVGEHAGWVIDILWWATRLTFNSSRVLRHMTRLLHFSGDTPLAIRTLRLYVQVVGKAWQASKEGVGEDTDTDEYWVETLVFGARMLCRYASTLPGLEGISNIREAGVLVVKARTRLDVNNKRLGASIELADGVYRSIYALTENDSHKRPTELEAAHSCFLKSVETYSTPSGCYHLALSFSRAGPLYDVQKATEFAGLAVEADPSEVRYWHLLGLLLTVAEKWKEAAVILEHGAGLDDVEVEETPDNQTDNATPTNVTEKSENKKDAEAVGNIVPNNGNEDATQVKQNSERKEVNGVKTGSSNPVYLLQRDTSNVPPASQLLMSMLETGCTSKHDAFLWSLQLRMTQATLVEVMTGAEGAELVWVDIFSWIAEKKGAAGESLPRPSIDGTRHSVIASTRSPSTHATRITDEEKLNPDQNYISPIVEAPINDQQQNLVITVSQPSPQHDSFTGEQEGESVTSEKKDYAGLGVKRSTSVDRDTSKSKKVQQMLKNRVHKGQARISAVSRKIGHGVVRNGSLRRSSSTPDFHAALRQTSYQASSIHSRKRLSSIIQSNDRTPTESPPPPPPPAKQPAPEIKRNSRAARENRLLSDLWLMSAATFRRLGKIDQSKGAIQEAEVRDEHNPGVWVQLGLYYISLGHRQHAIDTFHKALFISPDDIPATVHLCRLYLTPDSENNNYPYGINPVHVDLAAGMLSHLTRGNGWDVPEAWYYLAKAYGLQGRKDRERKSLTFALTLSEGRGIRDIGSALGWCM